MKTARIALLSNVNINFVIRMLQNEVDVYEAEGYGNELGVLMNEASSLREFGPEYTFLIMDLLELLGHDPQEAAAAETIENWFGMLETALSAGGTYYVSDAWLWGVESAVWADPAKKQRLEGLWLKRLERTCAEHPNVRIFPYRHIVERMGEDTVFSLKLWYMGRILWSNDAQRALGEAVMRCLKLERRVPKKVLLLDLDNTLWGGLAGEADHTPILLSEEHTGLAYKNLQRVILQMQRQGVLLAIVSKNNEEDVAQILQGHPHMLLREDCFVAKRINWRSKNENIEEIAAELNLGRDSFVFWDDNPAERELVRELLPDVTVPDFPDRPEELAPAMAKIYRDYFAKAVLTKEDLEKTGQYAANAQREDLKKHAGSFEDYLEQMAIVITRVNPAEHLERMTQLANKTNQFNLTTLRYEQHEMQKIVEDAGRRVYLYAVADRFGDNGVVAMVIVRFDGELPCVEEFVMSCRVMGKEIENAVLEDVEQDVRRSGYTRLKGIYVPTAKNKPVARLYGDLGYEPLRELENGGVEYVLNMEERHERKYHAEMVCEDR